MTIGFLQPEYRVKFMQLIEFVNPNMLIGQQIFSKEKKKNINWSAASC